MKSLLTSLLLIASNAQDPDIPPEASPQAINERPSNEYRPLMSKQTIPLHEIPSQVGTESIGDCEFYLILSPETEDVIMYIIAPETYWMGVGFGEAQMDGSLAYIYSENDDGDFEIWEYELGNHVINKRKRKINSYQVQTLNGYTTVMLRRPFNGNPGEYDFSVYDDNLKYIIACGSTSHIQFHDMGFRANWIGLSMLPPPTQSPTEMPTMKPTINPSMQPTTNPTEKPTMNPTMKPTNNPSVKPTNMPTGNPTIKPSSSPVITPVREIPPSIDSPESPEIVDIFDRDTNDNIPVRPEIPSIPSVSVNDITNNNCALDVVFIVDTSKYKKNECIVQGDYVEALMWGISEKNSQENAARYTVITTNGCSTVKELSFDDDWMVGISNIDFCLNEAILTNNECDQCLDSFSLAIDQFERASPNKKVVILMTNTECDVGLCQEWKLKNLRDTEVWIYNVGDDKRGLIKNDLTCVSDYSESFKDPWLAYSNGESEQKFLDRACVNVRRGGNINNNQRINREQIDIIGGIGVERQERNRDLFDDNRFNRENTIRDRFGTDEERFGRIGNNNNNNNNANDEERFGNFFNRNNEIDGNVDFFNNNGQRPNAGFWSRLENGGGVAGNTDNDDDIPFDTLNGPRGNGFTGNSGFRTEAGSTGIGRALSGNVKTGNTNTNTHNNIQIPPMPKGGAIKGMKGIQYQNELRGQATINQQEVITKRDYMRQKVVKPNYMPENEYNFKGNHNELRDRATYMQKETINAKNNVVLPNPPQLKGTPVNMQSPPANQRYTSGTNINMDNNRHMQIDRMNRGSQQHGSSMQSNIAHAGSAMYKDDSRREEAFNRPPPHGLNRPPPAGLDTLPKGYQNKGAPNGMNRPLPHRYTQDPQYPQGPPKGYNRPLPAEYLADPNYGNMNTNMNIPNNNAANMNRNFNNYAGPKGKDFNSMYPQEKARNFNHGGRT